MMRIQNNQTEILTYICKILFNEIRDPLKDFLEKQSEEKRIFNLEQKLQEVVNQLEKVNKQIDELNKKL